jgi:hypothetical protein
VLVLSKGDPALLQIDGVEASHFPQDAAGGYAGHHPRDGEDAIAQLEALRRRGAEYLVIPSTAMWWLDHYGALAEHLAGRGRVVAEEPGTCLVVDLCRGVRADDGVFAPPPPPRCSPEQLRDFLERLLGPQARVMVIETGAGLAAALAPVQATAMSPAALAAAGESPAALAERLGAAADYLVVPRESDEWLELHPEIPDRLESACRKLADQRHLGRVFDLGGPGVAA